MKFAIVILAMLIALSACNSIHSNAGAAYDRLIVPDVLEYSAAEQDRAALEMSICTNCETLRRWVNHYGVMRDQARVALGRTLQTDP